MDVHDEAGRARCREVEDDREGAVTWAGVTRGSLFFLWCADHCMDPAGGYFSSMPHLNVFFSLFMSSGISDHL